MAKAESVIRGNPVGGEVEIQLANVGNEWAMYMFIDSELIMSDYGTEERIKGKFEKARKSLILAE